MSPAVALALVFLACSLTLTSGQSVSCKGRCGSEYYRGHTCQCDSTCLAYDECCADYESQCTTENSCQGRCGEAFRRGRRCSCDPDCQKFKQCCSDFQSYCEEAAADGTPKDGAGAPPSANGGNDPDDQLMAPVSPAADPDLLSDELDDLPNDGFAANGAGGPKSSPDPGSTSGDGLSADPLDRSTDSTQDSNSAEFSRETSTVVPPALSRDEDGGGATLPPSSGLAATDKAGADELSSFSDPPQAAGTPPSTQPPAPSGPQKELSSAVGPAELEPAEVEAQTGLPEPQSSTPASSDGPPLTQTAPTSAAASTSPEATVGITIAVETSEWTGSSAPSGLQPTATTPKDTTLGPLLQELLTTLVSASSDAARGVARGDTPAGGATNAPLAATHKPGQSTSEPWDKVSPTKPVSVAQSANAEEASSYQADDSSDTDLCSGRPVSGVTTLRNGTMVVFRGHYFWVLDRNKVPGAAQSITQVWGVPSPIDTVFTRCNCQGKTYIFKGNQYWRFENGAVDPGYPKQINVGFDGLQGHITAALSVPQYRQRRESVYFFKRVNDKGGVVQKYSYQFTPSSTCGTKPKLNVYTVRNRVARQAAASNLGPTINIRASWRGFPATITAAVSVPNKREPDGYKYYLFSRANFYTARMGSERPALATPATNTAPQNNFFNCPKKN